MLFRSVAMAVDEVKFNLTVDKMRETTQVKTGEDPFNTVEVLGDKYILNKNERASILRHFIKDNDFTQYGLVNAVTRAAQDVESYDRSTELERMGGVLLEERTRINKDNKLILLNNNRTIA